MYSPLAKKLNKTERFNVAIYYVCFLLLALWFGGNSISGLFLGGPTLLSPFWPVKKFNSVCATSASPLGALASDDQTVYYFIVVNHSIVSGSQIKPFWILLGQVL
jgi:hypothetical protein